MTKKFGFTLAEVLITLGIIGVVAAMTMPTLINQTNGAQYKAAYKKALSAIAQGVTLNVALDDVSFADTDDIKKLLTDRMNVVKTDNTDVYDGVTPTYSDNGTGYENETESNITLFFNDGSMFSFPSDAANCTKDDVNADENVCKGIIDVNGIKGPNKVIKDANYPTDIYPVEFYDQTIQPATEAAKAVLYGK